MSESVNYRPTVTIGSAAGIAILAAAGANATIAGASMLFKKMMQSETWLSTCDREKILQETILENFEELSKSNLLNIQKAEDNKNALKIIAMTKALGEVGNLSAMIKVEHGKELESITKKSDQLFLDIKNDKINGKEIERKTNDLNSRLRTITSDAHQKLANAEESVLRNIVGKALNDSGFKITVKKEAIRATKGTTCIWMDIDQKARMSLDVSGFSGLSCQKTISGLESKLADEGIALNRKSCQLHGKKEGGDLVKKLSDLFAMSNKSSGLNLKKNKNKLIQSPVISPESKKKKQKKYQTIRG